MHSQRRTGVRRWREGRNALGFFLGWPGAEGGQRMDWQRPARALTLARAPALARPRPTPTTQRHGRIIFLAAARLQTSPSSQAEEALRLQPQRLSASAAQRRYVQLRRQTRRPFAPRRRAPCATASTMCRYPDRASACGSVLIGHGNNMMMMAPALLLHAAHSLSQPELALHTLSPSPSFACLCCPRSGAGTAAAVTPCTTAAALRASKYVCCAPSSGVSPPQTLLLFSSPAGPHHSSKVVHIIALAWSQLASLCPPCLEHSSPA